MVNTLGILRYSLTLRDLPWDSLLFAHNSFARKLSNWLFGTGKKARKGPGHFADIQLWRNHNLKTLTISSEGNLPADLSGTKQQRQTFRLLPPRKVRAIMLVTFMTSVD
jgi:hypothetical protein